ncbi:MAG: riboflavin synthase [Tepidisphaeraceae bacterium]
MFCGIVEMTLRVVDAADGGPGRRLTLAADWTDVRCGQSIAVNGCCLTVAEIDAGTIGFDVVPETLRKTNLGLLQRGDRVNVERSLRIGDRLDGHFVQGHVDGRALLTESKSSVEEARLRLQAPADLAQYLVPQGSVALDGVSLTVAAIHGNIFEVALIPTTLQLTTLGQKSPGWPFNLEADILAKTIVSWLERQRKADDHNSSASGVS